MPDPDAEPAAAGASAEPAAAACPTGVDPASPLLDAVDLWWLPLGAGGHVVKRCGRVYEALAALRAGRPRQPLVHAALQVVCAGEPYVIELAPQPRTTTPQARGVVATGPVGLRVLGHSRMFRYEVRRWPGGSIPDLAWAMAPATRLAADHATALAVLTCLDAVPTPVWGRDELRLGEMWNSNSVIAWALTRAGLDAATMTPPGGARAPGWTAGARLAAASAAPGGSDDDNRGGGPARP